MFEVLLKKNQTRIILYFLIACISIFSLSCAGSKRFGETHNPKSRNKSNVTNQINVLLQENLTTYTFNVKQEISISNGSRQVAIVKSGNEISFKIDDVSVIATVGRNNFESDVFICTELSKSPIIIQDKKYRGEIVFLSVNNKLQMVNSVNLEDYLKGVLPVEMGVKGKLECFESLKAFAIAARTFALLKMSKSNNYFDIYPDVRDQVYGGYNVETSLDNRAVEETKGEYLSYSNEYATILYHSTCGGMTEDVENVFSATNIPYLKSQKDGDDNCRISPSFNWTETYSNRKVIEFLLNAKLINDNSLSVKSIDVFERFPSDRIKKIIIKLSNQTELEIGYRQIRSLFRRTDNNGILRSTNFTISTKFEGDQNSSFTLTGKGNGHGVGLCQWGSMALSSKGWNYRKILEFYFPSTTIRKINA